MCPTSTISPCPILVPTCSLWRWQSRNLRIVGIKETMSQSAFNSTCGKEHSLLKVSSAPTGLKVQVRPTAPLHSWNPGAYQQGSWSAASTSARSLPVITGDSSYAKVAERSCKRVMNMCVSQTLSVQIILICVYTDLQLCRRWCDTRGIYLAELQNSDFRAGCVSLTNYPKSSGWGNGFGMWMESILTFINLLCTGDSGEWSHHSSLPM